MQASKGPKRIWIDLDNSPHVPFFVPIIQELEQRGPSVTSAARNAFQMRGVASLFRLSYRRIGCHDGVTKFLFVTTIAACSPEGVRG